MTLILTFAVSLLQAGSLWAQTVAPSAPELMGTWHSDGIYCSTQDPTQKYISWKKTRLFPIESLDFEPDVTLTLFNDGRQTYLRKSAGNRSCKANDIQEKNFIDVTYVVNFVPNTMYGTTIYTMKSSKMISPEVNEKAFEHCGSRLNGLILRSMMRLKYPEYFNKEMGRLYHLIVVDGHMTLRFQDEDICGSDLTVMTFSRSTN